MLQICRVLHGHLSEDELLALRDGRDRDPVRLEHLRGCRECRRRFAFLSAFKDALRESSSAPPTESLMMEYLPSQEVFPAGCEPSVASLSEPSRSSHDHPDANLLAAYFDGTLPRLEREGVRRHILDCERCMADLLVLFPGKPASGEEELIAAREHFREHGLAVRYGTGTSRPTRPQLVLHLEDGPGAEVRFRVEGGPTGAAEAGRLSGRLEERIEVMVEASRVTVGARREGRTRYLDIQLREPARGGSRRRTTVAIEQEGRIVASLAAARPLKASLAVPDLPAFDLRIDGGWPIPVFLRFLA